IFVFVPGSFTEHDPVVPVSSSFALTLNDTCPLTGLAIVPVPVTLPEKWYWYASRVADVLLLTVPKALTTEKALQTASAATAARAGSERHRRNRRIDQILQPFARPEQGTTKNLPDSGDCRGVAVVRHLLGRFAPTFLVTDEAPKLELFLPYVHGDLPGDHADGDHEERRHHVDHEVGKHVVHGTPGSSGSSRYAGFPRL